MNKTKVIRFIKDQKRIYLLFLLILSIFLVNFLLFRLPMACFFYSTFLSLLFLVVIEIFHYKKYKRKHEYLLRAKALSAELIELKETTDLLEEDYIEIIDSLKNEIITINKENNKNLEDISEYFSTWIHQIKTPITAMNLILDGSDSKLSRMTRSELMQIERYVEMVLTYFRLDSISTDYKFLTYSVDDLIKETMKKYASEFILRKIDLEYEETGEEIITDKKWFLFVLDQIFSNSLKYTPSGKIEVGLKDKKLFIKDTGIGIAEEDLPRIFEKGYTGKNGRESIKASGLGLYLTKRTIDNLGLKINIDSKIDEGTTVTIDLRQRRS